ncbi:MAG TPA: bifunctional metallophosphatase/5'-nucleotidase, partial [Candidatus Megamonas gallistercoris]|nr:bifunctional metallophosphatase/5'-nucleotidase [Candidatus Megamonas gallistercoris]
MYKKLLNSFITLFTVISIFLSATVLAADKPIIILYTNDIHCGIEDNIGFAKVARYKQDLTQITPYIALVDAGDAVQGA